MEGAPLLAYLIITAAQGLFAQVAHGATIVSIAAAETGRPKPLSASLDPAFSRMGAIVTLVLIVAGGIVAGAVLVLPIVFLPYVALRIGLCFEVMMLEEIGPWAAIRRSWGMTRGHLLRLLGVAALSGLVAIGPLAAIEALSLVGGPGRTVDVLVVSAATFAQGILVIPLVSFLTATTTLFYLQLRTFENARTAA